MRLKNVNTTLFILAGLLCLSLAFFVTAQQNSGDTKNIFLDSDQDGLTDTEEKAYGTDIRNPDTDGDGYSDGSEVKAGYNPLIKAPGDKLYSDSGKQSDAFNLKDDQNLTNEVAQEISLLVDRSDSENQLVGIEDIQSILNSIMDGENFKDDLPEVSEDDIKIKKQNYNKLSNEEAAEKEKEDALDYSVAVLYIFISNSPKPLTSLTDAISVINEIAQQIFSSFDSGNSKNLDDLAESGTKIYDQLKEVEVPENMADTQIKALQYALYSQNLKDFIQLDPADPLANLSNYSKIGSFLDSFNNFYDEIDSKLSEYGIESEELQNRLKNQGINENIFED